MTSNMFRYLTLIINISYWDLSWAFFCETDLNPDVIPGGVWTSFKISSSRMLCSNTNLQFLSAIKWLILRKAQGSWHSLPLYHCAYSNSWILKYPEYVSSLFPHLLGHFATRAPFPTEITTFREMAQPDVGKLLRITFTSVVNSSERGGWSPLTWPHHWSCLMWIIWWYQHILKKFLIRSFLRSGNRSVEMIFLTFQKLGCRCAARRSVGTWFTRVQFPCCIKAWQRNLFILDLHEGMSGVAHLRRQ